LRAKENGDFQEEGMKLEMQQYEALDVRFGETTVCVDGLLTIDKKVVL
jgi:hypothetical protein